ncbi:MAG TPA: hypothetical protein VFP65_02815 [Anaeromyxobacteraceae bacterium]|nr:hypothetical protein [Anaeromyxobacteraceae bacterium]
MIAAPRRYFDVSFDFDVSLDPLEGGVLELPLDDGLLELLEPVPLEDVSLEPVPLELEDPVLLWCFELFFFCFDEDELVPLASSLLPVPDRPVAEPLDVSDEPVEPLIPPVVPVEPDDEPEEPIEPPAPEVVSLGLVEPVLEGALAPALEEPAPVPLDEVSLEDDGLELELDDGLELLEDDDGLEDELDELWSLFDELEDAPDEVMSIIFAVSPENEARTCAPSLMSDMLACEPSLVTFVLWSTLSFLSLPESESVLSCWSNFCTFPWIES